MRGAVSHPFLQGLGQLGCFLPQDGSEGPALGLRAENQAPLHSMTGREGSVSEVGATDWPSKLKPSEVELPPPCPSGQGPGLVSPDHTWDPWPIGCAHAGASLPQTWALAQNSPTFPLSSRDHPDNHILEHSSLFLHVSYKMEQILYRLFGSQPFFSLRWRWSEPGRALRGAQRSDLCPPASCSLSPGLEIIFLHWEAAAWPEQ